MSHILAVLIPFSLACLVLAILPGPATAVFLHRTWRDGTRAGLAAVAGSEIGLFGWDLAGGAGLSALLAASHVLFDVMHIAGAVILIVLGVQAWRSARDSGEQLRTAFAAPLAGRRSAQAAFASSLVSMAANPKAALFAISFFPQFLPRTGPVFASVVILAMVQVLVDSACCVATVFLAGRARAWLQRASVVRRIERGLGAVLIALGVEVAVEVR